MKYLLFTFTIFFLGVRPFAGNCAAYCSSKYEKSQIERRKDNGYSTQELNSFIRRIPGKGTPMWVEETADGGYVLLVSASDVNDRFDKWVANYSRLIKVDRLGKSQWESILGDETFRTDACCVCNSSDGGFVVCGTVQGKKRDTFEAFLSKINSEGNLEWERRFTDTRKSCFANLVMQAADGGYLISGRSQVVYRFRLNSQAEQVIVEEGGSFAAKESQPQLWKVGHDGTLEWEWPKEYQTDDQSVPIQEGGPITQGKNGTFYVMVSKTPRKSSLVALSSAGELVLGFDFDAEKPGSAIVPVGIEQMDGGDVLTCERISGTDLKDWLSPSSYVLQRISNSGHPIWQKNLNASGVLSDLRNMEKVRDNSVILWGSTSWGTNLIKIDSIGNNVWFQGIAIPFQQVICFPCCAGN